METIIQKIKDKFLEIKEIYPDAFMVSRSQYRRTGEEVEISAIVRLPCGSGNIPIITLRHDRAYCVSDILKNLPIIFSGGIGSNIDDSCTYRYVATIVESSIETDDDDDGKVFVDVDESEENEAPCFNNVYSDLDLLIQHISKEMNHDLKDLKPEIEIHLQLERHYFLSIYYFESLMTKTIIIKQI
jgi:hypothetical protein